MATQALPFFIFLVAVVAEPVGQLGSDGGEGLVVVGGGLEGHVVNVGPVDDGDVEFGLDEEGHVVGARLNVLDLDLVFCLEFCMSALLGALLGAHDFVGRVAGCLGDLGAGARERDSVALDGGFEGEF